MAANNPSKLLLMAVILFFFLRIPLVFGVEIKPPPKRKQSKKLEDHYYLDFRYMKIHIFALRWKDEIRRSSQLRTLLKRVVVIGPEKNGIAEVMGSNPVRA